MTQAQKEKLGGLLEIHMINTDQIDIYNDHLAISRRYQAKPFTLRKNFGNIDDKKALCLERLEKLFKNNPNIDQKMFFEAPYKLYNDVEYYDLEYFTKSKAIKVYTQYRKQLELENPDTKEALTRLRDGLKFVKNFCEEKDLTLDEYETYCEGNLPCYIQHLKNHEINFYVLHSLSVKVNIEKEILDFIFGDFYSTFQKTRNKFLTSKKMKEFSYKAKNKLNDKLKQRRKTNNN